jgi:hypothetical protein
MLGAVAVKRLPHFHGKGYQPMLVAFPPDLDHEVVKIAVPER